MKKITAFINIEYCMYVLTPICSCHSHSHLPTIFFLVLVVPSRSQECKVASTDKSYSDHVLMWTYPTPSPTNRAHMRVEPYKSDSEQFCLSYNHIKYELIHFFSRFLITIFFICMYILCYKKKSYTIFFIFNSITFNKA